MQLVLGCLNWPPFDELLLLLFLDKNLFSKVLIYCKTNRVDFGKQAKFTVLHEMENTDNTAINHLKSTKFNKMYYFSNIFKTQQQS